MTFMENNVVSQIELTLRHPRENIELTFLSSQPARHTYISTQNFWTPYVVCTLHSKILYLSNYIAITGMHEFQNSC